MTFSHGSILYLILTQFRVRIIGSTIAQLADWVALLSDIQEQGSLENSEPVFMRQFIGVLSQTRSDLGVELFELISNPLHPLFQYTDLILRQLGLRNPSFLRRVAHDWMKSGNTEQIRTLARSYAYCPKSDDIADLEILENLMALKDDAVNLSLTRAFLSFESIASERVASHLLSLAQTGSPQTIFGLLEMLAPDERYPELHYQTYILHPRVFRDIVFETARLNNFGVMPSYYLSIALHYLVQWDLGVLMVYLERRAEYYSQENRIRHLMMDDVDLRFVTNHDGYRHFLCQILEKIKNGNLEDRLFWIDALESILVPGKVRFDDFVGNTDLTTQQVLTEWVEGDKAQLTTVLYILDEIHPWELWFDLMRKIVGRGDTALEWENLMRVLYTGSHSGSTSQYYAGHLNIIRQQRRENDSLEMKRFINYMEHRFSEMVEREIEREKEESSREELD